MDPGRQFCVLRHREREFLRRGDEIFSAPEDLFHLPDDPLQAGAGRVDDRIGLHLGEEALGIIRDMDAERLFRSQDFSQVPAHHILCNVHGPDDLHVGFGQDELCRGQSDRTEPVMDHLDFSVSHLTPPDSFLVSAREPSVTSAHGGT